MRVKIVLTALVALVALTALLGACDEGEYVQPPGDDIGGQQDAVGTDTRRDTTQPDLWAQPDQPWPDQPWPDQYVPDQYVWPDQNPPDQYVWPDQQVHDQFVWPDTYAGTPFGCETDAQCFGKKCCKTPWGIKICADSCGWKE